MGAKRVVIPDGPEEVILAFGPRQAAWPKDRIEARVSELLERLRLAHLAAAKSSG